MMNKEEVMTGIKKQTYSEQVADYIKTCILNGELSPGDQIKEVELAEKLSISRAPIREALQILSREGLLHSMPQKGKYIATLTAKEIRDSYFTGGVLEGASTANSIDLFTETDFSDLEELVEEMRGIAETGGSLSRLAELDDGFHGILFSKTDNDLLVDLSRRSCQGISKFLLFRHWQNLFSPEEIHDRHRLILDTLRKKDPWAIEECIRMHYIESGKRMSRFGSDILDPSSRE